MSLLDRIRTCQAWQPEAYRRFMIGQTPVGRVRHALARRLADFPEVFQVSEQAVSLVPALADFEARTRAVDGVVRALVEAGDIRRYRGEDYPVVPRWGDRPFMKIDRGAVPDFGVRGYGVHLNGLVEGDDGLMMWVAKRAMSKPTGVWPIEDVVARVRDSEDFKFNVALVIVDFLIRRGFVTPDDPDYMALVDGLHLTE